MGVVAIIGIIYGFMQLFGTLGLNHASPLVVPELEQKGHLGRVKCFLKRSVLIIIITSSSLAFVVFMASPYFLASTEAPLQLMQFALIIGPFSSLEAFLDSFLLARYSVRRLAIGRVAFDITRVIGTVGFILLGFGLNGVVIGWLLGEIIAVVLFGIAAMREVPMPSVSIKTLPVVAFGLSSLAFHAIDITIQNTDRIILLELTNLSTLGVYDVILSMLFFLSFVSLAVSTSIYPILTKIRVSLDEGEDSGVVLGRTVGQLLRYVMILLLPVAIISSMNSQAVLELLFGASYANFPGAALSFAVLIVSYALWGATYALHAVLRSMGEARFFVIVGLTVIPFEIIGCWYLTQWLGLFGSALIRSSYILLLFLASLGRTRQRGVSGLSSVAVSVLKIVLISLVSGMLVAFIAPTDAFGLLFWLVLAFLLFIVMLFGVREINELDFRLVKSLAPTSMHRSIDWLRRLYFRSSVDPSPEV